jgi:hypothetical protein
MNRDHSSLIPFYDAASQVLNSLLQQIQGYITLKIPGMKVAILKDKILLD